MAIDVEPILGWWQLMFDNGGLIICKTFYYSGGYP